jgi:hypothetical protein
MDCFTAFAMTSGEKRDHSPDLIRGATLFFDGAM